MYRLTVFREDYDADLEIKPFYFNFISIEKAEEYLIATLRYVDHEKPAELHELISIEIDKDKINAEVAKIRAEDEAAKQELQKRFKEIKNSKQEAKELRDLARLKAKYEK